MKRCAYAVIILSVCVFPLHSRVHAQIIDLTSEDLYVRTDFSERWTAHLPDAGDTHWKKLPAVTGGKRKVKVRDLGLSGVPQRPFLSPKKYAPQMFTFVTSFNLPDEYKDNGALLAMKLATIGENWEIYLNGTRIRQEMHLNDDGSIAKIRVMRDVIAPLDPRLLAEGRNILSFKIVGDPTYDDTGFYQSGPYIIDEYQKILDENSETLTIILLSLYFFVGLYHIYLFIRRRSEPYNLFYGVFSVLLFVYLFMRTHTVYAFIDDTSVITRIELSTLYLLIPLIGAFFDLLLDKTIHRFTIGYGAFCIVLSMVTIPMTLAFDVNLLRIWQVTAIVPLVYYSIIMICRRFWRRCMKALHTARSENKRGAVVYALADSLLRTVEGFLFIGVTVMFVTTVFDIIDSFFLSFDLVLTRYGFFIFVVGTAFILGNRFMSLYNDVEILNEDLAHKIQDLNYANKIITLSEEKYRLLVEGTTDCIFTLDEGLKFISMNRAMLKQISMQPNDVVGAEFFDIVYNDPEDQGLSMNLLREKISGFIDRKSPMNCKVRFKSAINNEPKEYQVRLEYIDIDGKNEILGKAVSVIEDSLMKYFVSERLTFVIGNYLSTAEEISQRLVRNCVRYMDQQEVNYLRIGLREMIINAIEHGNLNISFDEKTRESMNDNYLEFVMERQHQREYRDRKVTIELSLNPQRVAYKITDEGDGFNYKKIFAAIKDRVNDDMLAHGRGITMAQNIFDEIAYNKKGNLVLLVKRFSGKT